MGGASFKLSLVVYISIFYNILEAVFAIGFGLLANSIALIGFGFDSFGESVVGLNFLWGIHRVKRYSKNDQRRFWQKPTVFVATTFFILGVYVFFRSVTTLTFKEIPSPSLPGIIIAIISLLMTPLLSFWDAKSRNEQNGLLSLKSMISYLLLVLGLMISLILNYKYRVWQADPIIGLVTVGFLFKKSLEGFLGREKDDGEIEEDTGDNLEEPDQN